jgi:hypothetical protein
VHLDQVQAERAKQQARQRELGAVRSGSSLLIKRLAQEGLLRAGYALSDHTRNALILAVFGFKVRQCAAGLPLLTGQVWDNGWHGW